MPDILSTGSSALMAFQRVLATVSHNVANANTPGYRRQQSHLTSQPGQNYGFGFIGAGVQIRGVSRVNDNLLNMRLLESSGETGHFAELSSLASRVDGLFSDSATNIAKPLSDFLDAAQGVSSDPTSLAARQNFLGRAQTLVTRFHGLDGQLDALNHEVDQRLVSGVSEVNQFTQQIASLNEEIVRQSSSGNPPNDLMDQRDQLIQQLSTKIGVTTVAQDNGALNVFTKSGQTLVLGSHSQTMSTVSDPYQPQRRTLALSSSGGPIALPDSDIGGELGGQLAFRKEVIDPTAAQLGRLATGLTATFNAVHRKGMDLYGALGGDFFTSPTPTVYGNSANAGNANIQATVSNLGNYTGSDMVMSYDGATWTARSASTGAALPLSGSGTAIDPFIVQGMSLVVSGSASAGDSFLVRPGAEAAGQVGLAVQDPKRIAAASPLSATAALSNAGNGSIGPVTVTDASNPNLLTGVNIQFTGPNTYSINGSGSFAYTSGSPIAVNGWQVNISGAPAVGDQFAITPTGPNSSDNANAKVFADLGKQGLFDAGTTSLFQATSQLTAAVGSAASQASYAYDAQETINSQLLSQMEGYSGVNLDEEAATMLQFQQAYQAAARIISVADENFQSLLAAVR